MSGRVHHAGIACIAGVFMATAMGCSRTDNAPAAVNVKPAVVQEDEPEMKWAHEIAGTFLDRVRVAKFEEAAIMVVTARRRPGPNSLVSTDLRDELKAINSPFGFQYNESDGFASWSIISKVLSPAKDEASFKGVLEGPKRKV